MTAARSDAASMRAAVADRYGSPEVVRVTTVARPSPRPDEVVVRVASAAVTAGDARIRAARFPQGFAALARLALGVRRPRRPILGGAFSGVVDSVGSRVDRFAPGDLVCGMTGSRLGSHAELVAVKATRITTKPSTVSHDDAAAVLFGGSTALHFLTRKASVAAGDRVLVNGAAGAVGTMAVQMAARAGAIVTAVASGANAELVRRLGATAVIDHTVERLDDVNERFDVVLDAVGNFSIASGRRLLTDEGVLLLAVASLGEMLRARGAVRAGTAPERVEDFDELLRLVADGELVVPIERTYPLADIVAAHRRVDSGRKVGNLVVKP